MQSEHIDGEERFLIAPSISVAEGERSIRLVRGKATLILEDLDIIAANRRFETPLPRRDCARLLGMQGLPSFLQAAVSRSVFGVDRATKTRLSRRARLVIGEAINDALSDEGEKRLRQLIDAGILISERHLLSTFKVSEKFRQKTIIGCFGIVTADRPAMLARSLPPFAKKFRMERPGCRLFVVDDSKETDNTFANRATVQRAQDMHGPITFVDRNVREAFAQTLAAKCQLPKSLLEFALLGDRSLRSTGAARNFSHLLGGGGGAMFCDDDTVPAHVHRSSEETITCHLRTNLPNYDTTFYPNQNAIEQTVRADPNYQFIERHERVLGSVSGMNTDYVTSLGVGQIDDDLCSRLEEGNGYVALSVGGMCGDTGMRSQLPFLLGVGYNRSLSRSDNEKQFLLIKSSRQVLHIPAFEQVSSHPTFQTMSYCIDLGRVYIPFFPTGRNTDGAFSHVLRKVQPEMLTGHLPIAICHQPPALRLPDLDLPSQLRNVRIIDWLILLMQQIVVPYGTPIGDSLRSAAVQLRSHAERTPKRIQDTIHSLHRRQHAQLILTIERTLDSYHLPAAWQAELRSLRSALVQHPLESDTTVPVELAAWETPKALDWMRDSLLKYSDLLEVWLDVIKMSTVALHANTEHGFETWEV